MVMALDLPMREAIADACVEIDAFGESQAERFGDLRRHAGIDVAAAGDEFDPQLARFMIVSETADDGRGHVGLTLDRAHRGGRIYDRLANANVGAFESRTR